MSDRERIAVVILAAGNSRRLDNFPKQLLKFNGKTLIRHIAESAVDAMYGRDVYIVMGGNSELILPEIMDLPLGIISCVDWEKGMGASIKSAVKNFYMIDGYPLEIKSVFSGICFLLVDQPMVDEDYIRSLIETFKKTDKLIVASEYENTVGVPAIFSKELFIELSEISPDEGAKKIIQENLEAVEKISFPGGAIDIDTRQDYENLLTLEKKNE